MKPRDIQDFNDLKRLPFLTKQIVQNNSKDLVAKNFPKSKLKYVTSGGSTGIPMGFYEEIGYADARERAFIVIQWNRVGYRIGDKSVVLRGKIVKSAEKGRYWQYDPVDKQLVLSSYHMISDNLPKYVEKIREFKPKFIQAYPSAITILARFMQEHNVEPFESIKAILCGSENLYDAQRKLLEDTFDSRVYSWHGHSEKVLLGSECEYSPNYHYFPEYGHLELIDEDGNEVTTEDELGEIVGTGFNNYAMPFIRYRTGDIAIYSKQTCSCGRNYLLLKRIEGRVQEFIVTKDGNLLPHIAWAHNMEWSEIEQIQFLQEERGELIIKVVKAVSYTDSEIKAYILGLYGPRFKGLCGLNVRFVDHIPRTKSGKYRFLIQKLPIEFGDQ